MDVKRLQFKGTISKLRHSELYNALEFQLRTEFSKLDSAANVSHICGIVVTLTGLIMVELDSKFPEFKIRAQTLEKLQFTKSQDKAR